MQARAIKLAAVVVALLAGAGLALVIAPPLGWFHPPAIAKDPPLRVASTARTAEVRWDAAGVAHVYGEDEAALALGLGFAHGRDRSFQLELMRHAAQGRLTELFGEEVLWLDQRLRLVSYGLDEQILALDARDVALLEAYTEGVNLGRTHAGASLEMRLLGLTPAPWTPRDTQAIARLQSWELALDFTEELARDRIVQALAPDDPRRAFFLAPVPDGGVPIVRDDENEARAVSPPTSPTAPATLTPAPQPAPVAPTRPARPLPARQGALSPFSRGLFAWVGGAARGASNSWVVHGSRTTVGAPVLCNDPHLRHTFPSVFYMAHLEAPDVAVAGVTFPGIPAVLIGRTPRLAWAMTTSYVDAQDLVRLQLDPRDPSQYLVDGVPRPLRTWTESYRLGPGADARTYGETWRASHWGPLLPPGYDSDKAAGDPLALSWTGFSSGGFNAAPTSGFWDLARATDLASADRAVSQMSIAGQNVSLAFTDGTIAYRLAAAVPVRANPAPTSLPRDGSRGDAGWRGHLAHSDKPRLTNPARGYIVTANQRVVSDAGRFVDALGGMAAPPHRAQRINERLEALLASGKVSPQALLGVQQDVVSTEARALAPRLAAVCPERVDGVEGTLARDVCAAVRSFDGAFAEDAPGALPFSALWEGVRVELLSRLVGEHLAVELADHPSVTSAIERAVLDKPSLFDDPKTTVIEDLSTLMPHAMRRAAASVRARAGTLPAAWRWGAVHTLALKSPLARAPLVGRWFASEPVPQGGHGSAVRAEQGLPVGEGAAFRMLAVMTATPDVRMVIDGGNSGHVGHPHALDQREAWRRGALLAVPFARADVEAATVGRVVLAPPAGP